MSDQVRKLQLNAGEHLESKLFRFQIGWKLHFVLGPTLHAQPVQVFCNHPPAGGQLQDEGHNRHTFYELPWQSYSDQKYDQSDVYCQVNLTQPGPFQYYFTYTQSGKPEGSGYFVVDPILMVGSDPQKKRVLPLDSLCIQTVLTKCLGPFHQWEERLAVAMETGYNIIHFTPLQELGGSNSSYSLRDQHQFNPSVKSNRSTQPVEEEVASLVDKMAAEWEVLSITDIVLNHTSYDSPWLKQHPECAFNVVNSPHLRPAYLLDRILWHMTCDVISGQWADKGIPSTISEEHHLQDLKAILLDEVLPKYKLAEYYQCNIDALLIEFKSKAIEYAKHNSLRIKPNSTLKLIQDTNYRRLGSTIDMDLAVRLFITECDNVDTNPKKLEDCCAAFSNQLLCLNLEASEFMQKDLVEAVNNVLANVRYHNVDHHGPRIQKISIKNPLVKCYFTHFGPDMLVEEEEKLMDSENASQLMTLNGWVMNDDPLKNFADSHSKVYFKRELICWEDSVKLRYGDRPEDCPYLWDHMLKYTQTMAKLFHGFRIDNCHSTPLAVAEYMLDAARIVRPNLYVVAELFTQSEHTDNFFVNRLGINSLIREAMSAWDAHEEGRQVYRYGGQPVGSFLQPPTRPLTPCMAHALFMDLTHDNPSPIKKRSVYDLLPSSALVAMANCATGSNRGYDELVPYQIHVVEEERLYTTWTTEQKATDNHIGQVNLGMGIIAAKKALNILHQEMALADFTQVYVDQVDDNIIAVTRHCPLTHQSVILVAHTAFKHPDNPSYTGHIPPLCIPGVVEEIILEGCLAQKRRGSASLSSSDHYKYVKSQTYINGLLGYTLDFHQHISLSCSNMVERSDEGNQNSPLQEVDFINFPPGSIIAFSVNMNSAARSAASFIRSCINQFGYRARSMSGNMLKTAQEMDFKEIANNLSLRDLNYALYRCEAEEKDDGNGGGAYSIPGKGPLVYCGLQGFVSALANVRSSNDLGHPICQNLREGDWMPEYIANRLVYNPETKLMSKWFKSVFHRLRDLPRFLIPAYFDAIVTGAHTVLLENCWGKMSEFIRSGSSFVKQLALGSVQLCGVVKTSPMPPLSPSLKHVPSHINSETGRKEQYLVSMAAGLPHFSAGLMRCWGRDTFISLRGLLLVTGRSEEAQYIILGFGSTLRHGLIPNLLGGGSHARFNCRDAAWWWLQSIQDYCHMTPGGHDILQQPVSRMFPEDDSQPQPPGFTEQPLYEVIQELMQRHFWGVSYRERHAGPTLDTNMSDRGFDVSVGVDWETGFVYGGSEHNCGTWMDKVGESQIAGNKGIPATPRDGSAVEIVALCKSALRWLIELHKQELFPYDSITKKKNGASVTITYKQWNDKIQENFEKHFWIPNDPSVKVKDKMVNQVGIYKDSSGATQFWADYQLRPNFPIAIVVAPELFTVSNAWTALQNAEKHLLGPLGMKTLDPRDWAYNGFYDNSYDGNDRIRARGFNYHQGPEWLWMCGYFLRAKLHTSHMVSKEVFAEAVDMIQQTLCRHHDHLVTSAWRGLPELTNRDGAPCKDSCPIQAWSMASLLDLLYDLNQLLAKP